MAALGVATYSTATVALYNSWYRDYPMGDFRLFDDSREWLQMDKAGHVFSSYFQTAYSYDVARWTGLSKKHSLITGAGIALLSQTTIELMDGFSTQWGFSLGDIGANLAGAALFVGQEWWLDQQIVLIKESSLPVRYDESRFNSIGGGAYSTLERRATELFGPGMLERALKDYNVQTYWASIDVKSLTHLKAWPAWLNLAFGLGAQNLYGGFENKWTEGDATYDLNSVMPRYRQYYLSLDINWRKIRTKNHLVNGIFNGLNIFKMPAPAIEYSNQEWRFHLLFW